VAALVHSNASDVSPEHEIRAVLSAQVDAWNRGDIDAFMIGYWRSPETRFASGGTITRGWDVVRDRYKARYTTREAMGTLEFSELEVSVLSSESAVVFGKWRLARHADAPSGLFTLLFKKTSDGWKIAADHTSSAE